MGGLGINNFGFNFPSYWNKQGFPANANWQQADPDKFYLFDADPLRSEMNKDKIQRDGFYQVAQGPAGTDIDSMGAYTNYADFWNTGAAGIMITQNVPGGNWPITPPGSQPTPKNEFYGTDNANGVQWIKQTGQDQSINHIEARNAVETKASQTGQYNTFIGSRNVNASDLAEQEGFQNVVRAGQASSNRAVQNNTTGVAYFEQLAASEEGFMLLEPEEVEQLASDPKGSRNSPFSYNFYDGTGSAAGADQHVTQTGGNGTTNHIVSGAGGLTSSQIGDNAIHSVNAANSTEGATIRQTGTNAGKNVTGSNFNDLVLTTGQASNYSMDLNGGDDKVDINGSGNFGTIDGGEGNDIFTVHGNQNGLTLYGGGGFDTAQFDLTIEHYDIIETTDEQGQTGYTVRQRGVEGEGTTLYGFTNYQFGGNNYDNNGMQEAAAITEHPDGDGGDAAKQNIPLATPTGTSTAPGQNNSVVHGSEANPTGTPSSMPPPADPGQTGAQAPASEPAQPTASSQTPAGSEPQAAEPTEPATQQPAVAQEPPEATPAEEPSGAGVQA